MTFAHDLGFSRILLEGDALTIINRVSSMETDLSPIGHLVEEIKDLRGTFIHAGITHTSRKRNMAAHSMAKYALEISAEEIWIEEHPTCLDNILFSECSQNFDCNAL
ncbi:hypothetical protein REPUB_Repub10bG0053700 [Reevesia pubescens]